MEPVNQNELRWDERAVLSLAQQIAGRGANLGDVLSLGAGIAAGYGTFELLGGDKTRHDNDAYFAGQAKLSDLQAHEQSLEAARPALQLVNSQGLTVLDSDIHVYQVQIAAVEATMPDNSQLDKENTIGLGGAFLAMAVVAAALSSVVRRRGRKVRVNLSEAVN